MSHSQLETASDGDESDVSDNAFLQSQELPKKQSRKWTETDSVQLSSGQGDRE